MTVKELHARLQESNPPVIVDVREDEELAISQIKGAIHIPMDQMVARISELSKDAHLAILCRSGKRSARVVEFLVAQGFVNAENVEGGINAWASDVDPTLPVY